MTPEARFITLCAREAEAVLPGELHTSAGAVRDWAQVPSAAFQHRVTAFVVRAIERERLAVPEDALRALRQASLMMIAHAMHIDTELQRVLSALAGREIPAIVLKGPALARTIYSKRALRPYNDFDLTVHHQDEEAAVETLLVCGFREVIQPLDEACRNHLGHGDGVEAFARLFETPNLRATMDLHVDPLQLGLKSAWTAECWRRTQPVPGLTDALMLCPEDQLIQLSIHAHKHGFSRLSWLKDLDLLVRTHGDALDWDLVTRAVREAGAQSSIWLALSLAERVLATPVSAHVLAELRPSWPVRALYGLVWPTSGIANLQGQMRRRAIQFSPGESLRGMLPGLVLMGRRRDRAHAALRAVFRT